MQITSDDASHWCIVESTYKQGDKSLQIVVFAQHLLNPKDKRDAYKQINFTLSFSFTLASPSHSYLSTTLCLSDIATQEPRETVINGEEYSDQGSPLSSFACGTSLSSNAFSVFGGQCSSASGGSERNTRR
jgi:hypothetical protein